MRNRTPDPSHRWYDTLQRENTQALLDRLEVEMNKEVIEDPELIETISNILDERAPAPVPQETPEESLRRFRAQYAPMLEGAPETPKKPTRRGRRVLRVALAACLCVVMILVIAQACGFDLIGQLLEWREETFVLRGQNGGQLTLDQAPEGGYASAAEAAAACGITEPVAPTWIPERFHIEYVRVSELDDSTVLTTRYGEAGGQKVVLKIHKSQSAGTFDVHSEHSEPESTPYETHGVTFFLADNNAQYQAAWKVGGCTCSINGDLTRDELIQMIESIFETEKGSV